MNPVKDTQIEELQKTIQDRNSFIKELKNNNSRLQSENDSLHSMSEEVTKLHERTKKDVDEYIKKISEQAEIIRRKREEHEANKVSLQRKIEELKAKLNDEHSRILSYGGDQENIRNKIESEIRTSFDAMNASLCLLYTSDAADE